MMKLMNVFMTFEYDEDDYDYTYALEYDYNLNSSYYEDYDYDEDYESYNPFEMLEPMVEVSLSWHCMGMLEP